MASLPTRGPLTAALATIALLASGCGGGDDENNGNTAVQEPAASQPVSLSGGSSLLELDTTVDGILNVAGVTLAPEGDTEERDGGYVFPIRNGEINTAEVTGTVDHGGGLRLEAGGVLTVSDLVLDLGERVVTGTVDQQQLPVLQLEPDSGDIERNGDTVTVRELQASLTQEAADRANRTSSVEGPLGGDLLSEGQSVGEITVQGRTR